MLLRQCRKYDKISVGKRTRTRTQNFWRELRWNKMRSDNGLLDVEATLCETTPSLFNNICWCPGWWASICHDVSSARHRRLALTVHVEPCPVTIDWRRSTLSSCTCLRSGKQFGKHWYIHCGMFVFRSGVLFIEQADRKRIHQKNYVIVSKSRHAVRFRLKRFYTETNPWHNREFILHRDIIVG